MRSREFDAIVEIIPEIHKLEQQLKELSREEHRLSVENSKLKALLMLNHIEFESLI